MRRISVAVLVAAVLVGGLAGARANAQMRRAARSAPAIRPAPAALDAVTRAALLTALDEERKAHYAYGVVLAQYGAVVPFSTIVQAEATHVQAICDLMTRYAVPIPPDPWGVEPYVIAAPPTLADAYVLGINVEKEDIDLYSRLIPTVSLRDVVNVFTNLQAASRNHLAAFTRAASR
jgi:hypothetical protein